MKLGILLISHGILIILPLNPKKLPIKIRGKVQKIQRANKDNISEKLTAAFDFSIIRIMLIIIYPKRRVPGNIKEVYKEAVIQLSPPQNL